MKTRKDLFFDELADIHDAGKRTVKALPKLAKAATCEKLRGTFQAHLKETEGHVKQPGRVFECFDRKARGKTGEATVDLLQAGGDIAEECQDSSVIYAALVAAAQKQRPSFSVPRAAHGLEPIQSGGPPEPSA